MDNFGPTSVPEWLIPKPPHERRPALEHPDSAHQRIWQDRVWLRDAGYCQWCKKFEDIVKTMEVHHLTYERFGHEKTADGCLLCGRCHVRVTRETRRRRQL